MGRISDARDRLITAAYELMLSRGYTAIGVAEICARADVRKGSFYHFFPSKQALTLATLDCYWETQRPSWLAALGTGDGAGTRPGGALDGLERLLAAQARTQCESKAATGTVHGCLLGNLALELAGQDELVQARLGEIFADQAALVQRVLGEAAAAGEIPDPEPGLARAVIAQLEGMVLFAKIANDPGVLAPLYAQVRRLVRPRPS